MQHVLTVVVVLGGTAFLLILDWVDLDDNGGGGGGGHDWPDEPPCPCGGGLHHRAHLPAREPVPA